MEDAGYCTRCGTKLMSPGSPEGICPACLFKLGLSGAMPRPPSPPESHEPGRAGLAGPRVAPESPREPSHDGHAPHWPIAIVAIVALIALLAAFLLRRAPGPPRRSLRFSIALPQGAETGPEDGGLQLALAPDGRSLVFAIAVEGERRLWLRPLDSFESRALPETEGASAPFWSPDSRYIGFFAHGKLRRTTPAGGFTQSIADAHPGGGAWGRDGTIVFAGFPGGTLAEVSASGGAPKPVTRDAGNCCPSILPDGIHFLYAANSAVWVARAGQSRALIKDAAAPAYAANHLLYLRNGVLMTHLFDPHRLELRGESTVASFAERVAANADRAPPFSATDDVLAYQTGGSAL